MPGVARGKGVEGDEREIVGIEIELEGKSIQECTIDEPVDCAGRILSPEDETRAARRHAETIGHAIGIGMAAEAPNATQGDIFKRVGDISPFGNKLVLIRGVTDRCNGMRLVLCRETIA
jgi:hypothetical protein